MELNELRAFDRVRVLDAIDNYRVFYDVIEEEHTVIVRHVRHKGRKSTGEIV